MQNLKTSGTIRLGFFLFFLPFSFDDHSGKKEFLLNSTNPTGTKTIEDFDFEPKETNNPARSSYNPCDVQGICSANAKCETIQDKAVCSCPAGFSGVPVDGQPDPQHGCVRTLLGCKGNNTCEQNHSCVRDVCLQGCQSDTQCALGERCIADNEEPTQKVCIKVCFYDAHCLPGEYCEEDRYVCRPGCLSDSNCPFGNICGKGAVDTPQECEEGCHFSKDCPVGQECYDGKCSDPIPGFMVCGTNVDCVSIAHHPPCQCTGSKDLISPDNACVVASAELEDSSRASCKEGIIKTP